MKTHVNNLTSGSVLYYPTIEFQSDAWLKAAICTWEKVYRIVPPSYTPNDSNEVKEAIDAGLVESIKLEKGDLSSAAADFQIFIDNAGEFPAALQGHDNINVRLHPEKIDAALLPLLESLADKLDTDGFLSVSEEVADAYMLYLATNISNRRKIGKATDNEHIFSVDSFFKFEGNFTNYIWDESQSEVAASLVLPYILPAGIETDSMKRILDFRKQHQEARASYRETVLTMAKTLTEIESPSHAKEVIKDFKSRLDSSRKKSTASISEYKFASLAIGLPIAAGVFFAEKEPAMSIMLGTISVALIATMADANRSIRNEWKKSDAFYHLGLQREFGGHNEGRNIGIPRISERFHEFMDD
jgi:hypothetical protein